MIEKINTNQITTVDVETGEVISQIVQEEKQIVSTKKVKNQDIADYINKKYTL